MLWLLGWLVGRLVGRPVVGCPVVGWPVVGWLGGRLLVGRLAGWRLQSGSQPLTATNKRPLFYRLHFGIRFALMRRFAPMRRLVACLSAGVIRGVVWSEVWCGGLNIKLRILLVRGVLGVGGQVFAVLCTPRAAVPVRLSLY